MTRLDLGLAWEQAATSARRLAWVSLVWMAAEAMIGLVAGVRAGSVALIGWSLGSGVEALGAAVIVWRFSGGRSTAPGVERRSQQLIAGSFWLLAPYLVVESVDHLLRGEGPEASPVGLVLTGVAMVGMPLLGRAKHRLGALLGSSATAGEGTQNYLCAVQAATVLVGLVVTGTWPSTWWLDSIVAGALAVWAVAEGRRAWRGDDCC